MADRIAKFVSDAFIERERAVVAQQPVHVAVGAIESQKAIAIIDERVLAPCLGGFGAPCGVVLQTLVELRRKTAAALALCVAKSLEQLSPI